MSKAILSWDDYFMGIALLSSFRSKDPRSAMGACIVNTKNRIVGTGYNGFPNGCADDKLPWGGHGDYLDTKYPYVCHAELNAIVNSNSDLSGGKIYTSHFPCNECAKAIIQSGLREVVYLQYNKAPDSDIFVAARRMFDLAGVAYTQLTPKLDCLTLDFTALPPDTLEKATGYKPDTTL